MKSVGLRIAPSAANDLNLVAKLRVVMSTSSQNSERKYEWQPQLEEYAAHLDAIDKPVEHEKIFYDNLSGAFVWRDETDENILIVDYS
ncbi:MAG: hypothetical protein F6J87_11550 [Spirulina sp. SIO3F2]|nr:hypothetical protein [Spirulina sp. SIO3F2]